MLFCLNYDQPFLPSTAEAIRRFAADLYESGLSLVAARVYLSSVRSLHVVNCLADPVEYDQHLVMMLNGWKRSVVRIECQRLPITMCEMRKLKSFIKRSRWCYYDKRMMWSACTMAFFGFLRVSEFTVRCSENKMIYLKCGEVVCCKEVMTITLLATKSSQFCPVAVVIPSTDRSCCAVRAYLKYSHTHRKSNDEPVFDFASGKCLTRQRMNCFLRRALGSGYTSHSFRMGAATTASQCGVPVDQIRVLGRWKSDAYTVYIKSNFEQTKEWIRLMAG